MYRFRNIIVSVMYRFRNIIFGNVMCGGTFGVGGHGSAFRGFLAQRSQSWDFCLYIRVPGHGGLLGVRRAWILVAPCMWGSEQCWDALFAALAGDGYQPRAPARRVPDCAPRCTLSELLGEALAMCGRKGGEASGNASSSASSPGLRRRRSELTLSRMRQLGERYLMEYAATTARRMRGWASSWVARECPEFCTSAAERKRFLRCVRRWARKVKEGGFDPAGAPLADGLIIEERTASSQGHTASSSHDTRACTTSVPPSKRRRCWGAGGLGKMKMPEVGHELLSWFVDTLQNIKGRLPSCVLLTQARIIIDDLKSLHQQRIEDGELPPHSKLDVPVVDFCWLRRWWLRWGCPGG